MGSKSEEEPAAYQPLSPAGDGGRLRAGEAGQRGGVAGADPRLKRGTLGVPAPERCRDGVESQGSQSRSRRAAARPLGFTLLRRGEPKATRMTPGGTH